MNAQEILIEVQRRKENAAILLQNIADRRAEEVNRAQETVEEVWTKRGVLPLLDEIGGKLDAWLNITMDEIRMSFDRHIEGRYVCVEFVFIAARKIPFGVEVIMVNDKVVGVDGSLEELLIEAIAYPREWRRYNDGEFA